MATSGRRPISPDGARSNRWTVNITDPLAEKVIELIDPTNDPRFNGSRKELIEAALKYYLARYKAAGGELDRNRFPLAMDGLSDKVPKRPTRKNR